MSRRFWEIDAARGIAVVLMIVFNYAFALRFFGVASIVPSDSFAFWFAFPRFIGALFIFLAGAALSISYWKAKQRSRQRGGKLTKQLARKFALRGAKIFLLGLVITAATYAALPQLTVWFGILHLIGMSIILSFPFVERSRAALLLGVIAITAGILLSQFSFAFPWLLWLGAAPLRLTTLDYFPLLPWLGVMLLGVAAGNKFYAKGKRRFKISERPGAVPVVRGFCFLGRHSLLVYFAHVPALVALLYALGFALF